MSGIKNRSNSTLREYYYDLRNTFKYLKLIKTGYKDKQITAELLENTDITSLDVNFLKKIDTQVRTEVFSGIISKNYSDFGEKNTAEYISVMNNELEKIEDDYLSKVPYMLETLILSIIAARSLFLYSTEMAIVIIVCAIVGSVYFRRKDILGSCE